jgi:6-pyruvoyltetrahydropterin/6-carboxytetrahydropterin synthase
MTLHLTRRYRFSASHRLHSAALTDAENRRLYGQCNNPRGHGHNYVVEVTVSGPLDAASGMVARPADLDAVVEREVVEAFDHKYLNAEVAAFAAAVPTTENLCREIFRRLASRVPAPLARVRIEETGRNSFEYAGE